MELGLSLGDASTTVGFLKQGKTADQDEKPTKMNGLDFCMALGLSSGNQQPAEKKAQEIDGHDDDDEDEISQGDDDDDGDDESDDNQGKNPLLQLNLLPLVPVNPSRQIPSHRQSLPWSSDNGSSENGSSGNMGGLPAAARGLDVNRLPAPPPEEVSSANSVGSPLFHMDFGVYRNSVNTAGNLVVGGGRKRPSDFDAAAAAEAERASSRASDDDENGVNGRKKLRLSKQQSAFLEESFKEHNTLNPKQKLALAKQLNLRPRQVEVWFQNRRARTKLKQTEVDCEYLKRCCETLTEENRRLHKELQELRALKTSNPFYMQSPATTLTMCPSCERVATAAPPPPNAATGDCVKKAVPFPLIRPRFHPFSQTGTRPNNQPAAS